jgi:hypothetical protein
MGLRMSKKVNKPMAYTWVAYMITHAPEEMARVRKYGTPSDRLIYLASKRTFMTLKSGETRRVFFPVSLNTNRGQKLLFDILKRIDLHIKAMPIKAYELFQHVKKSVTHRRKDTLANLMMVAEAVIHRAASEYKTEVLFAFDSINSWIHAKYGKTLGYLTLRKAIEMLQEQGILRVNEWGQKNIRHKSTKIEILLLKAKTELNYSAEIDEWFLYNDHAMVAVYKRESVARKDVAAGLVHSEAANIRHKMMTERIDKVLASGSWLGRSTTIIKVERKEEIEVSDDYFTRLLGELVQSVHENDSARREVVPRIRVAINSS